MDGYDEDASTQNSRTERYSSAKRSRTDFNVLVSEVPNQRSTVTIGTELTTGSNSGNFSFSFTYATKVAIVTFPDPDRFLPAHTMKKDFYPDKILSGMCLEPLVTGQNVSFESAGQVCSKGESFIGTPFSEAAVLLGEDGRKRTKSWLRNRLAGFSDTELVGYFMKKAHSAGFTLANEVCLPSHGIVCDCNGPLPILKKPLHCNFVDARVILFSSTSIETDLEKFGILMWYIFGEQVRYWAPSDAANDAPIYVMVFPLRLVLPSKQLFSIPFTAKTGTFVEGEVPLPPNRLCIVTSVRLVNKAQESSLVIPFNTQTTLAISVADERCSFQTYIKIIEGGGKCEDQHALNSALWPQRPELGVVADSGQINVTLTRHDKGLPVEGGGDNYGIFFNSEFEVCWSSDKTGNYFKVPNTIIVTAEGAKPYPPSCMEWDNAFYQGKRVDRDGKELGIKERIYNYKMAELPDDPEDVAYLKEELEEGTDHERNPYKRVDYTFRFPGEKDQQNKEFSQEKLKNWAMCCKMDVELYNTNIAGNVTFETGLHLSTIMGAQAKETMSVLKHIFTDLLDYVDMPRGCPAPRRRDFAELARFEKSNEFLGGKVVDEEDPEYYQAFKDDSPEWFYGIGRDYDFDWGCVGFSREPKPDPKPKPKVKCCFTLKDIYHTQWGETRCTNDATLANVCRKYYSYLPGEVPRTSGASSNLCRKRGAEWPC